MMHASLENCVEDECRDPLGAIQLDITMQASLENCVARALENSSFPLNKLCTDYGYR